MLSAHAQLYLFCQVAAELRQIYRCGIEIQFSGIGSAEDQNVVLQFSHVVDGGLNPTQMYESLSLQPLGAIML